MASEDLTEAQIAALRDGSRSLLSCEYDWQEDLIAEVRRRRALDLTEEEVEALRLAARKLKRHRPDLRMDSDMTEQGQWTAMLAVLGKLLAGGS